MKKYQISAAQLIELIKNSQSKSSGNKIDSSSINFISADQLIERKKFNNSALQTNTSSILNNNLPSSSASSSSTKSYSLKISRNNKKSKNYFTLKIRKLKFDLIFVVLLTRSFSLI
jgi:hypothetical protein